MSFHYDFKTIEPKWQKEWEKRKVYAAPEPSSSHPAYYILVMFPYPSGNLHMGHVRNYTIGDVLARFYRKKGRSVLHPIGWDSFGLPAENAAIERKIHPSQWTGDNIAHMRTQLKSLAISYDWDREFATCDPAYYRWNQWIFLKMVEKGLAYQKKAPVNWCPKDATVLANEQVHEGKCWRCGTAVTQKELTQWFFKITDYAEQLLKDHDQLLPNENQKGWPEQVLLMQKNWIGASEGATVDFQLLDSNKSELKEKIRVFTTRPDTLFGATFMVLAPEHPLVPRLTTPDRKAEVEAYKEKAKKLSRMDRISEQRGKTGKFTGSYARNPVNNQSIPIWIADYVLTDYGTGAIMAVPAHDKRDFEFATQFKIPILQVIKPENEDLENPLTKAYTGDGVLVNSGSYSGSPVSEAKKKITDDLQKKKLGEGTRTFKIRDWLLSRQRYWGTPIPMVVCQKCGSVPVPERDLPVKLPEDVTLTAGGASPLLKAEKWINVPCPKCSGPAKRETDTMDTFVDSSWYYARYTDPKNKNKPFDSKLANPWLPVTQYVGGIEHACMHLIYARFFHKVLRDFGLVNTDEPFSSLLTQGMVTLGGSAMSKSKGNTVDPTDVIKKYGTDTCRLFILFAAPPTQQLEWSDTQVEGVWRFLNRVWRLGQAVVENQDVKPPKRTSNSSQEKISKEDLVRKTHQTVKRVTEDIERDFGFNTAISAIMELVNALYLYPELKDSTAKEAIETVIQLLCPFAPHLTQELWSQMGHEDLLDTLSWPTYDKGKLMAPSVDIVIQVNGKLKNKIKIDLQIKEDEVKAQALQSLVRKGLKIDPKRVIYIPHKLVNFVVQKN